MIEHVKRCCLELVSAIALLKTRIRCIHRLYRTRRSELRSILYHVRIRSINSVLCQFDDGSSGTEWIQLHIRGLRSAIYLRPNTSDFDVFRQVFLQRQYRIREVQLAEYAIDAGANIGLTSLYLLQKYPKLRIIAVEPDPENFRAAQLNLSAYSDRCHLIHGAIWSHDHNIFVHRGEFGDGRHWAAFTNNAPSDGSNSVTGYQLSTLLRQFGFPRIDLLKVDIEGAELEVFDRQSDTQYLERTLCCAIECHGPTATEVVKQTLSNHPFKCRTQGELLIAARTARLD